MATLICRSCRESVTPGDIICQGCRANLTTPDAVLDNAAEAAPPEAAPPEAATTEPDSSAAERPGPRSEPCPECGAELPPDETTICPTCLVPLATGAIVLRLEHEGGGWRHVITPGGSLVLGRDPRQSPAAAILASSDGVSRLHARVTVDHGRQATVGDLGSTNGTFVDGVPVPGGTDVHLPVGARLRLGQSVTLLVEQE